MRARGGSGNEGGVYEADREELLQGGNMGAVSMGEQVEGREGREGGGTKSRGLGRMRRVKGKEEY